MLELLLNAHRLLFQTGGLARHNERLWALGENARCIIGLGHDYVFPRDWFAHSANWRATVYSQHDENFNKWLTTVDQMDPTILASCL